jgi:hypothetical protein
MDFVPVNQVSNIEELDMEVAGMLSRACIAIDNAVGNVGMYGFALNPIDSMSLRNFL